MLTEQQRQQLRALQYSEQSGTITETERAELDGLILRVEAEEAAALHPTIERTQRERLQIEAQNAALRTLIRRKERLVHRLERFLTLSRAEREAIDLELAQILGTPTSYSRTNR